MAQPTNIHIQNRDCHMICVVDCSDHRREDYKLVTYSNNLRTINFAEIK